jgi:uncharacterized protein (TIGR00162 family)
MDEIEVETVAEAELTDPVLVEGLPGVGHVGKLAAEHLIEEFDGRLLRKIYSEHFPPQVGLDDDGVASLACAELYALDAGRDLLVLAGDHQATAPVGHYRLTETFLDAAETFGVSEVIAMGGVPTGELVEEHSVIGAVTDAAEVERFEAAGVEFRENEPEGGIVGTSGLLLGLGERRGIPAACLMGETSGYMVDPKSARAVLEVLQALLDVEVGFARLEERADEMEAVVAEMQEQESTGTTGSEENLRYFG